jgi:hypothetical protein
MIDSSARDLVRYHYGHKLTLLGAYRHGDHSVRDLCTHIVARSTDIRRIQDELRADLRRVIGRVQSLQWHIFAFLNSQKRTVSEIITIPENAENAYHKARFIRGIIPDVEDQTVRQDMEDAIGLAFDDFRKLILVTANAHTEPRRTPVALLPTEERVHLNFSDLRLKMRM